jgi:hypothetical protein
MGEGIRRVAQRPSSETVAPGGWGAKCPEPVVKQGLGQRLFLSRSNTADYGQLVVANLSGAR